GLDNGSKHRRASAADVVHRSELRKLSRRRQHERTHMVVDVREVTQLLAAAQGHRFAGHEPPDRKWDDAIGVVSWPVGTKRPKHDQLAAILARERTKEGHGRVLR